MTEIKKNHFKHRITVEQLNELVPEQQNKLCEWWKPNEGDFVSYCGNSEWRSGEYLISMVGDNGQLYYEDGFSLGRKQDSLPLLDIAQMIEFLECKGKDISFNLDSTIPGCELFVDGMNLRNDQLCDALWNAVKAVL